LQSGSPGILITKSEFLARYSNDEVGGGVVERFDYGSVDYLNSYPQRDQAGTKYILGIYSFAKVMAALQSAVLYNVQAHGVELCQYASEQLGVIQGLVIYGQTEQTRLGALSFNIEDVDHGLIAAY
jgi:selenocysteine lyase/cysteine desulfurase